VQPALRFFEAGAWNDRVGLHAGKEQAVIFVLCGILLSSHLRSGFFPIFIGSMLDLDRIGIRRSDAANCNKIDGRASALTNERNYFKSVAKPNPWQRT
jgi:hypothetical protein